MTTDELKRFLAVIKVELSAECEDDAEELLETIIYQATETDIELKEITSITNQRTGKKREYRRGEWRGRL